MLINECNILCIFFLSPGGTAGGQTVTLTGQAFSDDV